MNHFFVALGQNHLNNFEKLIDNGLIGNGQKILIAASNVLFDPRAWDRTFISQKSFDNKSASMMEQLSAIQSKIKVYKGLIDRLAEFRSESAVIYIAFIEDILSNFMFFSFSPHAKIVVVEDGTLNYYDHSFDDIDKIKFNLKKYIAKYYGIPFCKYSGHSSGAEDPRVAAQYLTFPKQAFILKNACQLPIKTIPLPKIHNSLYIIGQEAYAREMDKERFKEKIHAFFMAIKRQKFYGGIKKIYYKPHRNAAWIPEELLNRIFDEKRIELVDTKLTAEDHFFEKAPCRFLTGFDSSVFLNIYSKLTEQDKPEIKFYVCPINKKMTPLFEKLCFEFIGKP